MLGAALEHMDVEETEKLIHIPDRRITLETYVKIPIQKRHEGAVASLVLASFQAYRRLSDVRQFEPRAR